MAKRTNTAVWFPDRNRWQINVQLDGKRRTFVSNKPGRTGQREANAKADAWLSTGITPSDMDRRVEDVWADFLSWKLSISEVEYKKLESFGRCYFLPALGHKRVSSLSEQDLQSVLDYAYKHPANPRRAVRLSRKSLNNFRGYENQFAKYCRRSGLTTLLPEDLSVPAGARYCGKEILQIRDLVKLMNVDTTLYRGKRVPDDYINYYRFEVLTGLRPGEMHGLRWTDIQDDICMIRRAINTDEVTTHGKNENTLRSFKLIPMALQVLEDQRRQSGHMEEVFPMLSQRSYYGHWQRYQRANGINPPISLYEMRHTFVSATKRLPEGQLRQLVGHSRSMDTYGVYSHILETDADDTAEAVQDIFDTLLTAAER